MVKLALQNKQICILKSYKFASNTKNTVLKWPKTLYIIKMRITCKKYETHDDYNIFTEGVSQYDDILLMLLISFIVSLKIIAEFQFVEFFLWNVTVYCDDHFGHFCVYHNIFVLCVCMFIMMLMLFFKCFCSCTVSRLWFISCLLCCWFVCKLSKRHRKHEITSHKTLLVAIFCQQKMKNNKQ